MDPVIGRRVEAGGLAGAEIDAVLGAAVEALRVEGKRVLLILPDATRTMPVPLFFRLLAGHLLPRVRRLDVLVALGLHPPLDEAAMLAHLGITPAERSGAYAALRLMNHDWRDPRALATLGVIPEREIAGLSEGRLALEVPVRLNRLVLDHDHLLVCGPVFPHEVVGFSGGNKYFFPGIAGPDIIDFTHWLGALITTRDLIGTPDNPVRRVIDRAAALIPAERSAVCAVVTREGVAGLYCGAPEAAWRAAAALSAERHVIWRSEPVQRVLAVLPPMYRDLWVGAKGMYKTEPVVEDGGEVVVHAPHLREVGRTHGDVLRRIGYHVRDYFLADWERYKRLPWSVVAHATHLKGSGTYAGGVETPRIRVTLATGLSQDECRALGLGYLDPRAVAAGDVGGAGDGVLRVEGAGETLYRLRSPSPPASVGSR